MIGIFIADTVITFDLFLKGVLIFLGTILSGVVLAGLGAIVWRIPLGASNTILRQNLQDYKDNTILNEKKRAELELKLSQQQVDFDAKIAQLQATFDDALEKLHTERDAYKARAEELEKTVSDMAIRETNLLHRVADLERDAVAQVQVTVVPKRRTRIVGDTHNP